LEKIKKNTKKFEVEKLVLVVLKGKTSVQQYGVKTLNGNRNALNKNKCSLSSPLSYYYYYNK